MLELTLHTAGISLHIFCSRMTMTFEYMCCKAVLTVPNNFIRCMLTTPAQQTTIIAISDTSTTTSLQINRHSLLVDSRSAAVAPVAPPACYLSAAPTPGLPCQLARTPC